MSKEKCCGTCFYQIGNNEFGQNECKENCKLIKCPGCKEPNPEWLYDCHNNFCAPCAIELYNIFTTKLKLPYKRNGYYSKFMDLVADAYNEHSQRLLFYYDDSDCDNDSNGDSNCDSESS